MSNHPITCEEALAAIEPDPLNLSREVQAHLAHCPSCAEARVLWVAQEPSEQALAPMGYFEELPGRIARKLPPPRRTLSRNMLWAAALLMALFAGSAGGYFAGRAGRTPMAEAKATPPQTETEEATPEVPFTESTDDLSKLGELSESQQKAILERLKTK